MAKVSGSLVFMSVLSEDQGFAQQDDAPATRDYGQLILIVLVVLALAASITMMLTGNVNLLKIAMLAALWAAAIGIFLVIRYRNELNEQKLQHENQIEQARLAFHAEQAARELELEQRITEKTNDATQETLDKIKEQLDNLRSQLEMLSGLSFEEPTMIRAEAHRIKELGASDGMDFSSVDFDATTTGENHYGLSDDTAGRSDDISMDADRLSNARFGTYPTFTGSGSNATDMTDVFGRVPDPEPEPVQSDWNETKHLNEFPVSTSTNEDSAVDGEPINTDYNFPSYNWDADRYNTEDPEEAPEDAEVEDTGAFPASASFTGSAYTSDYSTSRLQNIYGRGMSESTTPTTHTEEPVHEEPPVATNTEAEAPDWRKRAAAGQTPSDGGGRRRKADVEPQPQSHRGSHRRPEEETEDTRHGRRRRDESGGVSVADLLRRNEN